MRSRPYTKSCRQQVMLSGENHFLQGRVHQLAIQYQMAITEKQMHEQYYRE